MIAKILQFLFLWDMNHLLINTSLRNALQYFQNQLLADSFFCCLFTLWMNQFFVITLKYEKALEPLLWSYLSKIVINQILHSSLRESNVG